MNDTLISDKSEYTLILENKLSLFQDRQRTESQDRNEKLINNFKSLQVADLLKMSGDSHTFQWIVICVLFLCYFVPACFMNQIPFLFFVPDFQCKTADGGLFKCSENEACSNPYGYQVDPVKVSLNTEFNIYCENKYIETASKTVYFLIPAISSLFVSILSDYAGRIPMFYLSWILATIGSCISFFSTDFNFIMIGMILSNMGGYFFVAMIIVYANEVIGSDLRSKSVGFLFSGYGFFGIVFVTFNIWITNYKQIFFIEMIAAFVFGFGYLLLCESPFFIFKQMKLKRLLKNLSYITSWNYRDQPKTKEKKIKNIEIEIFSNIIDNEEIKQSKSIKIKKTKERNSNKKSNGMFAGFDTESLKTLLLFIIFMISIYMTYGLSLIIPAELGIDNIYLNGILMTASEMIAYTVTSLRAHQIKRRSLNIYITIITICISAILLMIKIIDQRKNPYYKVTESFFGVFLKFINAINFSLATTYGCELFETKIRGLGVGVGIFVGRLVLSASSYLDVYSNYLDVHPMVFCGVLAIISLPSVILLPETLNKKMHN